MMKKSKLKLKDFDEAFDEGRTAIDFAGGILTEGLSKVVTLPPLTVPAWLAVEIENISRVQANSRASVVRQLLVEAIQSKKKAA